jgi:membrane-associated phospholipid phosphatase
MRQASLLFQGTLFLQVAWIVLRLLNHLSMTVRLPYADAFLSHLDGSLGLDWRSYFEWVASHRLLRSVLDLAYTSLTPVSVVAFVSLVAMNRTRLARYFLETFVATAVLCISIGMFFPAQAAVAYYPLDPALLLPFGRTPPGSYHLEHLARLRGPGPITLDLQSLPGLVTFPSFHTAAGVVLARSFFRTPLFWPALSYAVVMIAATPVFGAHYFVDLIAGVFVVVPVLWIHERKEARGSMGR